MTTHAPGGGSLTVHPNEVFVDGAYTGSQENGSFDAPYTTITAALAAAAAGDLVVVKPGAYTEDLTLVDGVDMKALQPGSVTITGSATMTDISLVLEGLNFIDDGAGNAFHFTGTAADSLRAIRCEFSATAGGGISFVADNTAGTVTLEECQFAAASGNANEVVQIEQGTVTMKDCEVTHADNTSESVVLEGDAATTFRADGCRFTGQFGSEAAVANPACTLNECSFTVGADHAILIAAGNTVTLLDSDVTSTEGSQDAIGGAGTISVDGVRFLSTADEYETTLTVTQAAGSLIQHGRYTEAAGAGTRAITLPQVMPSTSYTVIVTYEDTGTGAQASSNEIDTIATTGFNITTQGNGVYHWLAIHD